MIDPDPSFLDLLKHSRSRINFDDGTSTTAQDLATRGSELAGALGEYVRTGDRIALWMPSSRQYLEALAACAAGGFVAVNVNSRYTRSEATELFQRSGSRVVVTDQILEPDADCLRLTPAEVCSLQGAPTDFAPSSSTAFTVFTTSGTTSKPKMVLHNQGGITRHSLEVAERFGLSDSTPVLIALPMCGVFGLNSFAGGIAAGSPIWMTSTFDPEVASALIEAVNIVAMNGSDDMFHRLLETSHHLASLQIAGFGAFNSSLDDVAQRAETRGVKLSGLYGMSEVQALYAFRDQSLPLPARALPGGALTSVDAQVRVIDPDSGEECSRDQVGELQLKGPSLFAGYLSEGGQTVDLVLTGNAHQDGWFKTGDFGSANTDGSFQYISRMGDVLRLGGFLVAPAEIEEVVLDVPGVAEAQVVSVASARGMRPIAFVVQDQSVADSGDLEITIIAHCKTRLAKFKCPVKVIAVDQFPTTDGPNGLKIQRSRLREMAQEMFMT